MILWLLAACPVDVSDDMNARPPTAEEAARSSQPAGTSRPMGEPGPPAPGEPGPPTPGAPPPNGPQGPPLGPDGKPVQR